MRFFSSAARRPESSDARAAPGSDIPGEEVLDRLADTRVVAPEVEHAVAGRQVEVRRSLEVREMRPARPHVAAVEADGLQDLGESRVDVRLVQVLVAPLPLGNQRLDVEMLCLVGQVPSGRVAERGQIRERPSL